MNRPYALILVVPVLIAAAVLAGCGASALRDTETATEAKAAAAPASTQVAAEDAPLELQAVDPADAAEPVTVAAPAADNSGAWSVIDAGAQTFAANLDQANQGIASCQTDAAAGADFDVCMGKAYTMIAAAAGTLVGVIDAAIGRADGNCATALATFRTTTQQLSDDYVTAVSTTDWTSRDTLTAKLADDAQGYADTALAAASACAG